MYNFNAEVSKVLRLVIHSLYTNKDVFLRELISNASDACEKTRYLEDVNNLPLTDVASNEGLTTSFDRYYEVGFDTGDFVDNDLHREPLWIRNLNKNAHIRYKDTHGYLSHKIIGLYKYMEYLTKNDLWLRVGGIYMITGIDDDY